jgi:hypothetical protein
MQTECVHQTRLWLEDATNGVNALLASTARYAGDPLPKNVTAFGDEFFDEWVASKLDCPTGDVAIKVESSGEPTLCDGEVWTVERWTKDGTGVSVVIRLLLPAMEKVPAGRITGYYLRTILRSLKRFLDNDQDPARFANGIRLAAATQILWGPVWGEAKHGLVVAGAVVITYQCVDETP